ncbi:U-box domain-containing protein [Legionella fairfieldensis]|uniref:U-box domain-containing protein n=1 Tax=Legionella fairfieldensis TaxID=45064 RepID=UPI0013EF9666|nr:U-box domain-containing protein [Legionella fairfieldensis]
MKWPNRRKYWYILEYENIDDKQVRILGFCSMEEAQEMYRLDPPVIYQREVRKLVKGPHIKGIQYTTEYMQPPSADEMMQKEIKSSSQKAVSDTNAKPDGVFEEEDKELKWALEASEQAYIEEQQRIHDQIMQNVQKQEGRDKEKRVESNNNSPWSSQSTERMSVANANSHSFFSISRSIISKFRWPISLPEPDFSEFNREEAKATTTTTTTTTTSFSEKSVQEIPDELCCLITWEIMKEPVILSMDKRTYEKKAIMEHLSLRRDSPINRIKMHEYQNIEDVLKKDEDMEKKIKAFREEHPEVFNQSQISPGQL